MVFPALAGMNRLCMVAIIRSILPCCRNCMRLDETTETSSSLTPSRLATSAAISGSMPTMAPLASCVPQGG